MKLSGIMSCFSIIKEKSFESQLPAYRIDVPKSIDTIREITVRTSQLVHQFYEKQGFVLKHTKKGYWAKGFDMYYMEYENLYPNNRPSV